MIYKNIVKGEFIKRPNRFIGQVIIDNIEHTVHIKNTGRCKELLTKGAKVYLEKSDNPNRKTQYDLIAVIKNSRLINMDSQAPNKVFEEYLKKGLFIKNLSYIKAEYKFGNSRFDFYAESGNRKILAEVKGVTLEENGVVLFPDAPTQRGVKHLNELILAKNQGYETYVVFVIQMSGVKYFTPNWNTHSEFAQTLISCKKAGVNIVAFDCDVAPNSLEIKNQIPIKLEKE